MGQGLVVVMFVLCLLSHFVIILFIYNVYKLVFGVYAAILIMFFYKQLQDNIDLFCHTRHNICTILNEYVNLLNKFTVDIMLIHFHLYLE